MDGNKDAAKNCLDIGNKALQDGDKLRAHKFLSKAQRLDPTLPLEDLVSSLAKDLEEQQKDPDPPPEAEKRTSNDATEASSSGDGATVANGGSSTAPNNSGRDYTKEQVEIVKRIRKTKDYYQILGLEKQCSAEEIRKAYRKLSLKVHPDKNKAPGSDEAFKAVSRAFACLNDTDLRQKYDQYGPEEGQDVAQQQGFRHRGGTRNGFVYEDMFDADEIFNAFFYGSPAGFQRTHYVRTFRTGHGHHAGPRVHTREVQFGGLMNLLQLLPILLLFLISYFPFSSPVYNLEQVAPYEYKYFTKDHSVPFFVKSQTFDRDYPPETSSRTNIEAKVEREYVEILTYRCRRELGMRQWNPKQETPYCDRLRQFY